MIWAVVSTLMQGGEAVQTYFKWVFLKLHLEYVFSSWSGNKQLLHLCEHFQKYIAKIRSTYLVGASDRQKDNVVLGERVFLCASSYSYVINPSHALRVAMHVFPRLSNRVLACDLAAELRLAQYQRCIRQLYHCSSGENQVNFYSDGAYGRLVGCSREETLDKQEDVSVKL